MLLERRALLPMGAAALLTNAAGLALLNTGASAAPLAGPATAAPGVRQLSLQALHTGESLKLDYCIDGCYEAGAVSAINHILRDFRTNETHPIDINLLDLLHDLSTKLESKAPFQVISGYRSPLTNARLHQKSSGVAAKSLHMSGMAIDIRVAGRSLQNLHDAALGLRRGGVGYYPTSDFVHIDVGRLRKWDGA